MIKPQDIESKVFSSSMRGYNRREVDEFLDEIMIDYQKILTENVKLKQAVTALNQHLNQNKENEANVKKTLEQAKSLMSDISASAEKRAEAIVKNAKIDADNITKNARDGVKDITDETQMMRDKLDAFKVRFRDYMNGEIERISGASEDLFSELKSDFYPETGETKTTHTDVEASGQAETQKDVESSLKDAFPQGFFDQQQGLASEEAAGRHEQKESETGMNKNSSDDLDSLFDGLDEKLKPFDKAKTIVVRDTNNALNNGDKNDRIR